MSRDQGLLLLYPDKQNQFLLEGLFVAFVTVGTGSMLISAMMYANGRDIWGEILEEPRPRRSREEDRKAYNQNVNTSMLMFLTGIATLTFMFFRKAVCFFFPQVLFFSCSQADPHVSITDVVPAVVQRLIAKE